MESDNVKTPAELADEAKQTAREALLAARGYVQESRRIGKDAVQSIRSNLEDAKETGLQAMDTVEGLSSDVRDIAKDAAATGRAYAQNAVNATGRKLRDRKGQVTHAKDSCEQYVAKEPVRASLIAAATGAVLMTLMLWLTRSRQRYEP
jgi:ElaB/YqjD/DUF883 family membrane-anchored ribosome-binding protein